MKHLRFVGSAREDPVALPDSARSQAGYQLYMVQVGRQPEDGKPLPTVGPGAAEIRTRDASGAFRVVYVARFRDAIYVLHVFQKTTQKTRETDLGLARQRYGVARALSAEE